MERTNSLTPPVTSRAFTNTSRSVDIRGGWTPCSHGVEEHHLAAYQRPLAGMQVSQLDQRGPEFVVVAGQWLQQDRFSV